jgi:demethylmenaquinone methyltransferase/2-methoxy-6-polyprenyl-1,4-benzoquinol methylase
MPDDHEAPDDELLAEQQDFYEADAGSFDEFLGRLLDQANEDATARTYREGRRAFAETIAQSAPLGRVVELAAGTGRLAEVYLPFATSVTLVDGSPSSLAIARARLREAPIDVRFVETDDFDWRPDERFDTTVFVAWLHHVPLGRFDRFWAQVGAMTAPGGMVHFDVQDAAATGPATTEVPEVPAEGYGLYAPVDGVGRRDHFGRRWRIVHQLWDLDEMRTRLGALGWQVDVLGVGLFANTRWCVARRTGADEPG